MIKAGIHVAKRFTIPVFIALLLSVRHGRACVFSAPYPALVTTLDGSPFTRYRMICPSFGFADPNLRYDTPPAAHRRHRPPGPHTLVQKEEGDGMVTA